MKTFFYTQQYYTIDGRSDLWKVSYYPLLGTWNNKKDKFGNTIEEIWMDFEEPRALIERPIFDKEGKEIGIDFREVPPRYLTKA